MFIKKAGIVSLLFSLLAGNVFAGTLTNFAAGDVLICFRVSGNDNLVVDAGPISVFTNLAANQVYPITNYTPGLHLKTVRTNNCSWSAFAWFDDTVTPSSSWYTLFVSKARPNLNTQSAPWTALSADSQSRPAGDMYTVALGAKDNRNYNINNTGRAIVEPFDSLGSPNYPNGLSYVDAIFTQNSQANFNGDLNAVPENTTPNNFLTAGTPQRSDFYWVPPSAFPSSANVKFLGYFELNTNGAMNFVAYPTVAGSAPTVTTTAATQVTNNTATLNGTVNPNSQTTTAYFEYGLTTSYGSTKLISGTFTGSSVQAVSTNITGLGFNTTNHYRLTAYNATGTNFGNDMTFITQPIPRPPISSYTRSSTNSVILFPTLVSLTYTVHATNKLTTTISNWPVIAVVPGDGLVHAVTNGTASSTMFYNISAQ